MIPSSSAFTAHSDVLSALPTSDEEIQSLIMELRRRGNLAFKSKSFMEADVLYTKAIDLFPKDASIFSNRSAARLGMKNYKLALEDADSAIKIGGFPKAHFRRGQALRGLERFRDAQLAFECCASMEDSGQAPSEASKEASLMKEKADQAEAAPSVSPPAKSHTSSVAPKSQAPPATRKSKSSTKSDPEKEEEVAENGLMKGYKTLDDGRKTTFFHREIDADQKAKLEAENKPQALSAPPVAPMNQKEGSKWNAAGTFEEKDMTKFAQDRIQHLLQDVSTIMGESIVEVTKVSDFDGIASISVVRGTRKWPFDFTFNVSWTAHLDEGDIEGKLFCVQCSNSAQPLECEFEVKWENRDKAGKRQGELMKHLQGEFTQALEAALQVFQKEFTSMT